MRTIALVLSVWSSCAQNLPVDHVDGHCDLRIGLEPRGYCQEWRSLLDAPGSDITAIGVCSALGTDYVETTCVDEERIVAGCFIGTLGDGSESYWWFYDVDEDGNAVSEDDVRQECDDGDFVLWSPSPT